MESEVRKGKGHHRSLFAEHMLKKCRIGLNDQTMDLFGLRAWHGSDFWKHIPDPATLKGCVLLGGSTGWKARHWLEHRIKIKQVTFVVSEIIWEGFQTCPFQDPSDHSDNGYRYGNRDFYFFNCTLQKGLLLSDLSLHFLQYHALFCSGPSSLYRLDPVYLIEIFDI